MLEGKDTIAVLNWTGWIDHHGCATVSRRLSTELLARRFAVSVVPIGKNWKAYRKDLSKVSGVVINGEGTLHDSSLLGLGLLEIVDFCGPLGIPVFLINASWHNNDATH